MITKKVFLEICGTIKQYFVNTPLDSIKLRYFKGTIWSFIGVLVSQGMSLLSSIIIARIIGVNDFGKFGVINSTLGTLGIFAGLSLGSTATKYIAEFRISDPKKAGGVLGFTLKTGFLLGSFVTILLIVFSKYLANYVLNAPDLSNLFRLSALFLLVNTLNGIQLGALSGFEGFKSISIINIIRGLLYFPFTIAGSWFWGLDGVIIGTLLVSIFLFVISQYFLRKKCEENDITFTLRPQKISDFSVLYNFSIPAFLSGIIVGPATWIGNALLVNQLNGYEEMGFFNAANQWRTAILFFPGILTQVATPILTNLYGEKQSTSYKHLIIGNLLLTLIASIIVSLPICLFSKFIMSSYGNEYSEKYLVLIVVGVTTILTSFASSLGLILVSLGKLWQGFIINSLWAIFFVGFSNYFVRDGALGLSLSYMFSYVIHMFILIGYSIFLFRKIDRSLTYKQTT